MNLLFRDKIISGLLLVIPSNERSFLEEMDQFNFPKARSRKLAEVMGYDRHRIVADDVCVSDMAGYGFEYLFDQNLISKDDIDALIVVTQSPDYFMPGTSSVIQGRLGMKQDMYCLDINQGCAGFIVGMTQAFQLLEQESIHRIALVNADVLSRKVCNKDRNSYPLIGDAASITIIENKPEGGPIHANLKMDGTRNQVLTIPAGGFRKPSSPETAVLKEAGDNNFRAQDHLRMEGDKVFNFVMVEVPPMIKSLLAQAGVNSEAVDYFLFHQPNRFMLQKLAQKLDIPYEKMPSNVVEHYGNSSGVTIPAALSLNLSDRIVDESFNICFAGFGVGLTWGSMLMNVGPLNFCITIEYP